MKVSLVAGMTVAALAVSLAAPRPTEANPRSLGHAFAERHCAACHAIDMAHASPLAAAPPFRTLHEKYPVRYLEEALAEGIVTGHPAMPNVKLEPEMIDNLITFIEALSSGGSR